MNEYDVKSCNALEKPFYTPLEAAIRWCNLIAHEADIIEAMADSVIPDVSQFRQWPCLRVNTQKIMDAIDNGELRFGRDGKRVEPEEHIKPSRRTVRHADLKQWMIQHYPDQRPAFLFDETERSTHASINADSYRSLQADRDALQAELDQKAAQLNQLRDAYDTLQSEVDSLRLVVEKQKEPGERSETTYLKIILGMAMAAYRYEPRAMKNTAIKNIEDDLIRLGIPVSDDTIRSKLSAAKEFLPPEAA